MTRWARRGLGSICLWTALVLPCYYVALYALLDLQTDLRVTPAVDPLRTLLGGLATGLITAQALVFTITLVAAQLNARYTQRMVRRVFTWPTGALMGLFVGSIIYSLVILAALSGQSPEFAIAMPWGLKPLHPVVIALALAGTCLVLLIPYLWSFKDKLSPELLAEDQGNHARRQLLRQNDTEPLEVAALDNIAMSAYSYRDYDTLRQSLRELSGVGTLAWRLGNQRAGRNVLRRLAQIGAATVADPRAPFQLADALREMGVALIDGSNHEGARQTAMTLAELAEATADNGADEATRYAASWLSDLGIRAINQEMLAPGEEAASALGHLASKAINLGQLEVARLLAVALRRVGSQAADREQDLVARQAAASLWLAGASAEAHLPQGASIIAQELELLEQQSAQALLDGAYAAIPASRELEAFRERFLKEARPHETQDANSVALPGSDG